MGIFSVGWPKVTLGWAKVTLEWAEVFFTRCFRPAVAVHINNLVNKTKGFEHSIQPGIMSAIQKKMKNERKSIFRRSGYRRGCGGRGSRGGRGGRGGRGDRGGRGGRGGGGGGGRVTGVTAAGKPVVVVPHRLEGVFIARGQEGDVLATVNLTPGIRVYREKRINAQDRAGNKIEYRVWNPFRSKLAAAILNGIDQIHISPGIKVLYLGGASGTTVSHVSDLVGPKGLVYAVELSQTAGRDLINLAQKRTNIIPIIEDARHPLKYRMLVNGLVDTIFTDIAQPDQTRILALNSRIYLKLGGNFVMSIKAACVDSCAQPEAVFALEVRNLKAEEMTPQSQIQLEPFERGHAIVTGIYQPKKNFT